MSEKTKADLEAENAEQAKRIAELEQQAEAAKASPKAASGEKVAWQAPDYSGPLTIDQANWRHANIKHAGKAKAK